jgi:hypothetical protein
MLPTGVDYATAIALQNFQFVFAQSAGQERRRDGLRSDVEFTIPRRCNRA